MSTDDVAAGYQEQMRCGSRSRPGPGIIVLVGASGDLARRKVLPAIGALATRGMLPERFGIVATARSALKEEDLARTLGPGQKALDGRFVYVRADLSGAEGRTALAKSVDAMEAKIGGGGSRTVYLSIPPDGYEAAAAHLTQSGVLKRTSDGSPAHRLIVEKPFGSDVASARHLWECLHGLLDDDQVFPIDHYLGKETLQNVLVLRFANVLFEPLWNNRFIEHVEITAAEQLGLEGRAGYYDESGALRDMLQNHLMQTLSLIAMEPPVNFSPQAVRDEKVKVLRSVRPFDASRRADLVRGQYAGYLDEPGVAKDSRRETFVAARMFLDSWRWMGVPFYIRSGKKLARRLSEIYVQFKEVPGVVFRPMGCDKVAPNGLLIRIQPDAGVSFMVHAKLPRAGFVLRPAQLKFDFAEGDTLPDAYETLLLDAMHGDATLFPRRDEIDLQWRVVQPILDDWSKSSERPESYAGGSWGPAGAAALLARDGCHWHQPD